jgi:hypothetical protein
MKKSTFLYTLTAVFIIVFIVFSYKGYDKMNNYYNNDYSYENAYVGGDAYNYIINGTHATGYYVLSGTFFIAAVISLVGGLIISEKDNTSRDILEKTADNELPPL